MKKELLLDGHKLLYHLDVVERWLDGKDIVPIHAEISPTSLCNQKCRFCYRDFDGHKADTLKRDVFLGLMKSLAAAGVKSVLLAGDGEPLVNKATTEAILLGKGSGLDVALNTNGVLLKEEISQKILPSLTWLRFSIMSANSVNYAKIHGVKADHLKQALENIKRCVEIKKKDDLKVTLGIQQVLLNENGRDIYEAAKLSKEIGVDYYVLKPFSKHPLNTYDCAGDLHTRFEDEFKKAEGLSDEGFKVIIRRKTFSDRGEREYDRCLGVPFIVQIGADGGVYSCCPFFGNERFLFGNVNQNSFEEILTGEKRKDIIKYITENVDVHKECMTYCRHHQINKFLWDMVHPPQHANFI